jgi:hypothetical protein
MGIKENSLFEMHLQHCTTSPGTWSNERHRRNRLIDTRIFPEGD